MRCSRWFTLLFSLGVLAFFLTRLSENQADNDLWGHVLYGQRAMAQGVMAEATDPFSWTAPHAHWTNHEVMAELIMGWTHQHWGASGLLALPFLLGLGCLLVLRRSPMQPSGSAGPSSLRIVPWIAFVSLLLLGTNGIAVGFSIRPQLFTAFGLCLLLYGLYRLASGCRWYILLLPLLIALWVNTHGGALAGVVLLLCATGAEGVALLWKRIWKTVPFGYSTSAVGSLVFALTTLLSIAALFLNPYGTELPQWLLQSVSYVRPEITEWNPIPFSRYDPNTLLITLPYLLTLIIAAWAMISSRLYKRPWETAIVLVLSIMAFRHMRHAPLFHLAVLGIIPAHAADAWSRISGSMADVRRFWDQPFGRSVLAGIGLFLTLFAVFTVGSRPHPLTVVIENDLFPVDAIAYMQANALDGRNLTQFDWGQHFLWEMPRSQVSFDGRLDTVYSQRIINEHWRFYDGDAQAYTALGGATADTALLPSYSPAVTLLIKEGWRLVYKDPVAAVLVHHPEAYPALATQQLPVMVNRSNDGWNEGTVTLFPDQSSGWVTQPGSDL